MNAYTKVSCTFERHASQILHIYNDTIANTTSLYEYEPRTMQTMELWFATKREKNFPVIGVESDDGALVGFGSYGAFRPYPAKKYSVEHSVYVHPEHRGRGVGKMVLQSLVQAARGNDLHVMIGAIDTANVGSISLHERLGFKKVGTIEQVGFKFGRWLDMDFYQMLLDTPRHPVDG
ncbi:N-acetyltransferase family protein [Achromobacter seleniivolatilans]|uniref:N-acetyltransferase family protein n=1 Tax=Achromobacter seleniivolatilans TaxID=3047478 RepID=A0ABY9LYE8_9BURK|nr:GNAT family N-acetyltransferase [Achromobacter sp. R39]WMD19711.1 N-acetyltransferase family protein [Achromobacter sp. R39]